MAYPRAYLWSMCVFVSHHCSLGHIVVLGPSARGDDTPLEVNHVCDHPVRRLQHLEAAAAVEPLLVRSCALVVPLQPLLLGMRNIAALATQWVTLGSPGSPASSHTKLKTTYHSHPWVELTSPLSY